MSTLESTPDVLDVAGYAAAVRRSLVDLGRELVDDLTDGLEADLADALADTEHARHGGDLVAQFGAPEAYAAELRSAAGLAPGTLSGPRRPGESIVLLGRAVGRVAGTADAFLRARSWWPAAVSAAATLRPLWWVVRGWVAYQVAVMWWFPRTWSTSWIPESAGGRVALLLAVVASLVLGTSRSWRTGGRRAVVIVLDVFAVVALVVAVGTVHSHVTQTQREANAWLTRGGRTTVVQVPATAPQNGVVVGGIPVSNLFVYDAEGNPLKDVQIYDDRGRPVRTTYDDGMQSYTFPQGGEPWMFQGRTGTDGRTMWNVYPLLGAPDTSFTMGSNGRPRLSAGVSPAQQPLPFAKAPAVAPVQPAAATGPTTSAPSGGATP